MYLTIDLDFFKRPGEFSDFLNIFKFPKDLDFQRNHHSLAKNIIESGCKDVINMDTHDDLNPDYLDDSNLHCGNWVIYLLEKYGLKSYYWLHPTHGFIKCHGFYCDFWSTYKQNYSGTKFKSNSDLDYFYDMMKKITHVGVCVSPSYHAHNNCEIILKMLIDHCDKNNILLNGKIAGEIYKSHKKMLLMCTDDDNKRLLRKTA